MKYMPLNFLLLLLCPSMDCQMMTNFTSTHFKQHDFQANSWHELIFASVSNPGSNSISCGAMCDANEEPCQLFVMSNDRATCHLGNFSSHSFMSSQPYTGTGFVSLGKIVYLFTLQTCSTIACMRVLFLGVVANLEAIRSKFY